MGTRNAKSCAPFRLRVTEPVNYQWSTPDGTIHHGHTVILGRNKRELRERRESFWRENKHVDPAPMRDVVEHGAGVEYAYD